MTARSRVARSGTARLFGARDRQLRLPAALAAIAWAVPILYAETLLGVAALAVFALIVGRVKGTMLTDFASPR